MTTHSTDAFRQAISRTNGVAEVPARWVKEHLGEFDFVDVREPHELKGPLGAAEGTTNVPLAELLATLGARKPDHPVVLICRSGSRSGRAVAQMESLGFTCVASVEGGTIAWNKEVLGRTGAQTCEKAATADSLADAIYNTNGVAEVSTRWVHDNLGSFRLIDVRESSERESREGYVLQSEHVPLGRLLQAAQGWDKEAPYVVMCKSGGRSARGTMALRKAGFTNVASMEGGMMGWNAAGLPKA
ncbi:MAG: hypothetical protein CSA66_04495 [Proteobacteria bacterium]|nr:MAG: hypothetical protein CSA66_04495 [Pseudomonadota bacterium]